MLYLFLKPIREDISQMYSDCFEEEITNIILSFNALNQRDVIF